MELIGNPMMILDMNMQVAACSSVDVPDETWMQMKRTGMPPAEKTGDLEWRRRIRRILSETGVTHADSDGRMMLQKSLRINGCVIGQIHATACFRPFTEADYQTVELISDRIALALYQEQTIRSVRGSETEYFIQFLLDGKALPDDMLELRLKMLNWKLQHFLYVVTIGRSSISAVKPAMLAGSLCGANDRFLSWNGDVVLILTRDILLSEADMEALETVLSEHAAYCGISAPFFSLQELREAWKDARAAMEIGRRIQPERVVCPYETYRFYMPLHICAQTENILRYIDRPLLQLAEDPQHQELLRTVLIWVRSGRRLAETARLLHIHVNTVSWRIARFEQLTGMDTGDPVQFMQLAQMLTILEYADSARFFGARSVDS